jgi:hypothetical protein
MTAEEDSSAGVLTEDRKGVLEALSIASGIPGAWRSEAASLAIGQITTQHSDSSVA